MFCPDQISANAQDKLASVMVCRFTNTQLELEKNTFNCLAM